MAPERTDVRSGDRVGGSEPSLAARALFPGLIDYAGLFPPAALPMAAAIYNYSHYREIPFSWMLGRFILPASCLEEFEREAAGDLSKTGRESWKLSLISTQPAADAARLLSFNERCAGAIIDTMEIKAETVGDIAAAVHAVPDFVQLYCEIPLANGIDDLLSAIRDKGWRAKIRCGGITPDAFPASRQIIRFLKICRDLRVVFKATAGLHHAVRGIYPLTYEPGSPTAPMHGFLNLFLAAAWLHAEFPAGEATLILEEASPSSFEFTRDGISWRNRCLTVRDLEAARKEFAVSFGSCSFSEPVSELRNMGVVP